MSSELCMFKSVTFQSRFVFFFILFFQYSVFKMERCTADISVSHDPTISSSIEFKTKWKDTMHTLHVTHKNLFKRFVAGRSILNITIYDFFHCVVLVRVAGLRIRCFFSFQILSTVLPFTRQIWPRWRRSWVTLTWRVSPQPSDGAGASGSQQSVSWQDDGCWENNMSN